MSTDFIAVDWGTTNRRVFLIEDGVVIATECDDRGAAAVPADAYADEVAGIRQRFGDRPMLLAGMVGSTIGWRNVPYVPAPAGLSDLAGALDQAGDRIAIVPGLSFRDGDRADVMRGEEVQLLGAAAAGLAPPDALLCQPGTHCKWARLRAGKVAAFTTAMTGELFALLRQHSILRHQIGGDVAPGPAFRAGVEEGARRDLAASLFAIRARAVLGLGETDAASFASGVLIGADAAARIAPGEAVHILADPALGGLYAAVVEALGGTPHLVDSHAAFVAGITRLWELTQ